ncbi:MAG: LysM peptidoglycan-binding domain-containing protein [Burkholderiaceae bacterium]|jgi:nucleoid-associated protein YgaU|nr:LysM peptidoglycan-binding domain-containing protein [Burkholderiaceae bacterium]
MKHVHTEELHRLACAARVAMGGLALAASACAVAQTASDQPAANAAATAAPVLAVTPAPAEPAAVQQTAEPVGVPLTELAPNAPEQYSVRAGDTLWGISGKFLRAPWQWPQLWAMNKQQISNPHLIYPGQVLYLERRGDRAWLSARGGQMQTVRLTPQTRIEQLGNGPLPTLPPHLIEPFLAEPLVVDDDTFQHAPRIVATTDDRVLIGKGDRAYARGPAGQPFLLEEGVPRKYRVFREAVALKDPATNQVLGFEAQYVGHVFLERGETVETVPSESSTFLNVERKTLRTLAVPATVDVDTAKEEIKPGDRLLPEPEREYANYVPRAPELEVNAQVVSVYGNAVRSVGQNQIVSINKGRDDGIEPGHVLALMSTGAQIVDKTTPGKQLLKLPNERNGVGMVFRVFDRVSYLLVTEILRPVQVGDRLTNPN